MNMFKKVALAALLLVPCATQPQQKKMKTRNAGAPAACTLTRDALKLAVGSALVYGMFVKWPSKNKPSDEMFKILLKVVGSVVLVDLLKDTIKKAYHGTWDVVESIGHDVLPCHNDTTSAAE